MSKSQLALYRVRGVVVGRVIVVRVLGTVIRTESNEVTRREMCPYLLRLPREYRRVRYLMIAPTLFDWQRRRASGRALV